MTYTNNEPSVMDDLEFPSDLAIKSLAVKKNRQGPIPEKLSDINETIGLLNGVVDQLVDRISSVLADLPPLHPADRDDSPEVAEGSSTLNHLRDVESRLVSLRSRVLAITERVEL